MDLQKEREAFESAPEIKQWISALKYGEKTGVYIAIDNNKHEGVANWVNGAWFMWQAKAQAVPEGFVLVPKEPTPKMIDAGYESSYDAKGFEIPLIYKAMIEAQEPK